MRPSDHLARFVRESLLAGRGRDRIAAGLRGAGWSDREIEDALAAWQDDPAGGLPVPRPRPVVSARDAVVYGLLFASLVMVSWHVVQLGFGVIDRLLPAVGQWQAPASGIRWSIAVLLAFLPVFMLLDRWIARETGRDPGRRRSQLRRWFASVALLIAALVLLGDLVAVLHAGLTGDLTARFAARAGLVALMGVLVLAYYRGDLDG